MNRIASVALLVDDYDEAIRFFTRSLRFELIEDTILSESKRWVIVRPSGGGSSLLLAKAASDEQRLRIGDQTGGRVFLFLETDRFWDEFHEMTSRGVEFLESPRDESYGTVAVFLDLYGNKWDLIEFKK